MNWRNTALRQLNVVVRRWKTIWFAILSYCWMVFATLSGYILRIANYVYCINILITLGINKVINTLPTLDLPENSSCSSYHKGKSAGFWLWFGSIERESSMELLITGCSKSKTWKGGGVIDFVNGNEFKEKGPCN